MCGAALLLLMSCPVGCSSPAQEADANDSPDAASAFDAAYRADAAVPDGATPDAEPPPDAAPARIITGNNSAILPGDEFPNPGADNNPLRKPVPVTVIDPHPDIALGTGYITRNQIPESLVQFIIHATNTGAVPHCFVSANSITYRRTDDSIIDDTGLAYVIGSVQVVNGGVQTAACLRPGESGYLLELDSNLIYDEIASVEFRLGISQSGNSTDPLAECIPTSYTYDQVEGLVVPFENTGAGPCTVDGGFSRWVLLDSEGEPLWWIFLLDDIQPPDGIVAPGNTGVVENNNSLYSGVGRSIHAWIDFEDVTAMARARLPAPDTSTPEKRTEELWRQHNLRELEKQRRVERSRAR